MIIGLVLLGLIAVLLFFGVAGRVFKSFGVNYIFALVILVVLIGCAFIPTFTVGNVTICIAGLIAPVTFSIVFLILAKRSHELNHALVAAASVLALEVAIELLIAPISNAVVTVTVVGVLCGAVGYLVGKSKIASLFAVFVGIPVGAVIASAVGVFVSGSALRLGAGVTYDAVIFSAVIAIAINEAVAAIHRTLNNKRRALSETAEEFDPEEYKKYFDE